MPDGAWTCRHLWKVQKRAWLNATLGVFLENSIFRLFWAKIGQIWTKKRDFWKKKSQILPKIAFFHIFFNGNYFYYLNNTQNKAVSNALSSKNTYFAKTPLWDAMHRFYPLGCRIIKKRGKDTCGGIWWDESRGESDWINCKYTCGGKRWGQFENENYQKTRKRYVWGDTVGWVSRRIWLKKLKIYVWGDTVGSVWKRE